MAKAIDNGIKTDLNDKQKRFAEEYILDLNGRRAYKVAYVDVTDESADVLSCNLLKNVKVKAYINDVIAQNVDSIDISVGEIVDNIKSIINDDTARHSDKLKGLDMLARYKQMFVDKVEVTNTNIVVGLED